MDLLKGVLSGKLMSKCRLTAEQVSSYRIAEDPGWQQWENFESSDLESEVLLFFESPDKCSTMIFLH